MSEELSGDYQSNNDARVMREWEIRSYLGKILTIVESMGVSEKQEKAVKDLIKTTTWGELWHVSFTPVIRSHEADELLAQAVKKEYEILDSRIQTQEAK